MVKCHRGGVIGQIGAFPLNNYLWLSSEKKKKRAVNLRSSISPIQKTGRDARIDTDRDEERNGLVKSLLGF